MDVKDFGKETVNPTCSLIDANMLDESLTGKMLKIDLPKTSKNVDQAFNFGGSLLQGVGENTKKVIYHIYYEGEDNIEIVLSAKYSNVMIYYDIANIQLKKGMNTLEVVLTDKNWETLGELEYIAVYLGGKTGEPARTIYIVDSVIYEK